MISMLRGRPNPFGQRLTHFLRACTLLESLSQEKRRASVVQAWHSTSPSSPDLNDRKGAVKPRVVFVSMVIKLNGSKDPSV